MPVGPLTAFQVAADRFDPPPPRPELISPVAFAENYSRGTYQRYRHVEVMEQAILETIETGGRLILSASVRHSKSKTASEWVPAWYLGTHPDARVILAGHEADFAARWGRAARDILTEHGEEVFGVKVSPRSEAANRWDIDGHQGGMLTVGVGGSPIGRGADLCLAAGTLVETPQGPVDIATLAERGGTIWGYEHTCGEPVSVPIIGATESVSADLCEVHFESGRTIQCTPDHPIYVEGGGYVEAGQLQAGSRVKTTGPAAMRPVRGGVHEGVEGGASDREAGQADVLLETVRFPAHGGQAAQHAEVPRGGDADLCSVFGAVQHPRLRAREEGEAGQEGLLLFAGVRRQAVPVAASLRTMQRTDREEPAPVLLGVHRHPPERAKAPAGRQDLPSLRTELSAEVVANGVLLPDVREPGARGSHGGGRQLPLQGRDELRTLVQVDAPADHRTRRWLRRVWRHRPRPQDRQAAGGAPHQRGPEGQPAREPRDPVPQGPHRAPQITSDTVAVVRHLREGRYTVYDLEVEGTHNLFADEVLVHNCIIDDPLKSFEAAMSPRQREKVQDWWTGTMASRIEPGGAVILIMARWHEDDLAGYLLAQDPGLWRELRIPALCDDPDHDPLGRELGEALWPERWPVEALEARRKEVTGRFGEAVWLAQYQQRPTALEGGVFPEKNWQFMAPHELPEGLRWVRGWDLAASDGAGDWTASCRMARLPDGRFVIDDVLHGQWDGRRVRDEIKAAADRDPQGTRIELPQDPGQAGKDQAQQLVSMLAGHIVQARPQTGSKEVRAAGHAAQQQAGNVVLVEGRWNGRWVAEHAGFPRGAHDDQVDCGATAFNAIAGVPEGPARGAATGGVRVPTGAALAGRSGGRVTK